MHRVQSRTYVGQPGEIATVTTTTGAGGQVRVSVGGRPVVGGQFPLPNTPGATARMQIALAGPQGASCLVSIGSVDGTADSDFLLCTTFNPAPVNFYDFAVAAASAVANLARARGVPVVGAATAAARPGSAKPRLPKRAARKARVSRKGK